MYSTGTTRLNLWLDFPATYRSSLFFQDLDNVSAYLHTDFCANGTRLECFLRWPQLRDVARSSGSQQTRRQLARTSRHDSLRPRSAGYDDRT